ncbi:MAG TPA: hypothetical protein VFM19_05940 [Candidatus Limnocylindria bacterium]|nr:hypothetical protein [Candidatus Limnocylindria bacterium]
MRIHALLGLAVLLVACVGDGRLAQQRQQAADALDRWAVAAGMAGDGEITVQPPPWDPYDPPVGLAVESVEVGADDRHLVATFTGSPNPASEPCGIDYTGEAVESDLAVVVIIVEHRRPLPETCTSLGATRTATISLTAPLGERAVLDVQQGLPVEVVRPS